MCLLLLHAADVHEPLKTPKTVSWGRNCTWSRHRVTVQDRSCLIYSHFSGFTSKHGRNLLFLLCLKARNCTKTAAGLYLQAPWRIPPEGGGGPAPAYPPALRGQRESLGGSMSFIVSAGIRKTAQSPPLAFLPPPFVSGIKAVGTSPSKIKVGAPKAPAV